MRMIPALKMAARSEDGGSLIEFAVASSMLFLLIFGIIELAFVVYSYNMISFATRLATRYAVIHSPTSASPATTAQIQQVAVNAATLVNLTTSNVTVAWPTDPNNSTLKDAQVTISYTYVPITTVAHLPAITLTSKARMLVSQ
jgi:Flp pilus assembly protein TadG